MRQPEREPGCRSLRAHAQPLTRRCLAGIPEAFAASGLLLGPLLIFGMGCIMNATKDFMLEASGRAEALQRLPSRVAACLSGADPTPASDLAVPLASDYLVSAERKLEVSDLCHFFFGGRARLDSTREGTACTRPSSR